MEQLAKFGPIQAVGKFWNALTATQRFISIVFISTSVVLLVVVSILATRPRMEVLFAGLESTDAGAIVSKLQERGIPYEITGGGSVIKVPANRVHEMRLAMATQGLPQGGSVGFEIFDKSTFGMTEFSQRLNYQRALQGELSRTISQLDMVEQARVHISIPEPSVFKGDNKEASASVVVKLRPSGKLESEQVAGIVHLVAAAVSGLDADHVTVIDTRGNVLSEAGNSEIGIDPRLSASQSQLKRNYERQVEKDLQAMLDRVVGPDKAVVKVNARMNFDRRETNSETYIPVGGGKGILLSEEHEEETYGGNSGTVGGVVGMAGNVRPSVSRSVGQNSGYSRIQTSNKYQVSKTTEHIIRAAGSVDQLSVAVMLDQKVDASKIPAIQSAVEAAVGADPKRGDRVIVQSVPFDDSAAKLEKEMDAAAAKQNYLSIGKSILGVLILFGFLFFLRKTVSQIKVSIPERQTASVTSAQTAQILANQEFATPQQPQSGAVFQNIGPKSPEDVAQVIKSWISKS
ncbi:MAG: flagellar basal-body MS-ring/collar protein FliF [Armatimonadota bacterium]|nr:flagellar basal-body MS-ring/collar protein FliF [Armatimonadota bacterium]